MNLTSEQLQALENGDPVTVIVGQTRCVLVREDVYREDVSYGPMTPEERDLLACHAVLGFWARLADQGGVDEFADLNCQGLRRLAQTGTSHPPLETRQQIGDQDHGETPFAAGENPRIWSL